MRVERILVAVDFSPQSDAAMACALSFARTFDAAVTLLHVHELPTMLNPIVPGADNVADTEALRRAAAAQLDKLRRELRDHDPRALESALRIEAVVVGGPPAEAILAFARNGQFDLVVLGTHGHSGWRRLLLGSVAEEVLRRAECPVVTIRNSP